MAHEFVEITNPNRFNRRQKVLHRIEVPSLELAFHRPDVNNLDVLVYRRDRCVDSKVLLNTTATAFRTAVRNYIEEHYPSDTR